MCWTLMAHVVYPKYPESVWFEHTQQSGCKYMFTFPLIVPVTFNVGPVGDVPNKVCRLRH